MEEKYFLVRYNEYFKDKFNHEIFRAKNIEDCRNLAKEIFEIRNKKSEVHYNIICIQQIKKEEIKILNKALIKYIK